MENKLIQITGLPRSGTAFVATFLALHPECVSFHELITKNENYRNKLIELNKIHKFVIDSSTYGFLPQATFEQSRKVYLSRNIRESKKSAEAALNVSINDEVYFDYLWKINEWKAKYEPLTIKFDELFEVKTLKSIWIYCFGNEDYFLEEKAEHFIDMNIQTNHPEVIFEKTIFERINKHICQQ